MRVVAVALTEFAPLPMMPILDESCVVQSLLHRAAGARVERQIRPVAVCGWARVRKSDGPLETSPRTLQAVHTMTAFVAHTPAPIPL